jgi:glycosyltransferase involved in cell wall biosynthesis
VYYGVEKNFTITKLHAGEGAHGGTFGFLWFQIFFSEAAHLRKKFWHADVIYSRDAVVLLQYLLLGRNVVYEAHTKPTAISKFVARNTARKVVVISHGLAEAYERVGVRKERIIVAPDGVDLKEFEHPESQESARRRLGLPIEKNKKIVLYIGRLDGWKGVDTLCEATVLLEGKEGNASVASVHVAIIGGEPAQVESFKKKYQNSNLTFLGFHPYAELADNQAAADVLVLPNTAKDEDSARYTSPLKLFTYMASGKPIIASDLPSIREVLSDDSAYFFTPDDAHALAEKIAEALAEPDVAVHKAAKARELLKNYTWHERAGSILSGLSLTSSHV